METGMLGGSFLWENKFVTDDSKTNEKICIN
jgi:hypothetical protein